MVPEPLRLGLFFIHKPQLEQDVEYQSGRLPFADGRKTHAGVELSQPPATC